MGWKQGRILEFVLRPLPLAEVFFMAAHSCEESGFLVVELQVSATTAASVSPVIIDQLHKVSDA